MPTQYSERQLLALIPLFRDEIIKPFLFHFQSSVPIGSESRDSV